MNHVKLRIADSVERALAEGSPVVALESTVIAHGLPYPLNLETALACEETICRHGATPATLGIVDGVPAIGLSEDEIGIFAKGKSPNGGPIEKVSLNNLASVMVRGTWGATTVASSLKLAHAAGIRVFSTGGIGGVHRGAADSFDVSADLTALGNTPIVCVCAGAKAILDLPKTVEYLETLGIPIVGYCTKEFPAFLSRSSGLAVDITVAASDEVAEIVARHWQYGVTTAVLVCIPVPEGVDIPISQLERACSEVVASANRQGIRGKALTPFLLAKLREQTGGDSIAANKALLTNNAEIAARISASLSGWFVSRKT